MSQAKVDTVPQFYFPGGKPVPAEVREQALAKIDELFRSSPDGLAVPAVRELVKEVYYIFCCCFTINALFACMLLSVCMRVRPTAQADCTGPAVKQLLKPSMACVCFACFTVHSHGRSSPDALTYLYLLWSAAPVSCSKAQQR